MQRLLKASLAGVLLFGLASCSSSTVVSGGDGTDGTTGGSDGGAAGGLDGTGDGSGEDAGGSSAGRSVSGKVAAGGTGKTRPFQQDAVDPAQVVVMSAESGAVFYAETDDAGAFEVEIPEEEEGEVFLVTIVDATGQPAGPVMYGTDDAGETGFTGLEIAGEVDLGTIQLPPPGTIAPIEVGADADLSEGTVAEDVVARLDDAGTPVGVETFGRGDGAQGAPTDNPRQACDVDQDGLIDPFDADDDGDGVIDDIDGDSTVNPAERDGLILNFFMNLKIGDAQAQAYFDGDVSGIESSLRADTIITFEVAAGPGFGDTITGVRVIGPPSPAPSYLPVSTVATPGASGALWSSVGYTLNAEPDPNHFQTWITPNAIMNTGDTFTVEVTLASGAILVYSRMINFVFHSIPKVTQHGAPGSLSPFAGPATIAFDGTQDLEISWNPPVDDFGVLLTGIPYLFEVFYYDAVGQQINGIDGASTWTTAITGWDSNRQAFEVDGSALGVLNVDNEFSVQLPAGLFPDTVQTGSGSVDVTSYKVDVAAQINGNNSAHMLNLVKQ